MLPELREPGIPRISVQPQFQEIIIKGPDLWRLQLYRDSPVGFHLITFNDFISVCPAITKKCRDWGGERERQKSHKQSYEFCMNEAIQQDLKSILSQHCYLSMTIFLFLWRIENYRIIMSCLFFTVVKVMMKMMTVTIKRTNVY